MTLNLRTGSEQCFDTGTPGPPLADTTAARSRCNWVASEAVEPKYYDTLQTDVFVPGFRV